MKMFFEIIFLIIITALLICLFFGFARIVLSPSNNQYSLGSVCIKDKCFSVELAKTAIQRELGLMHRKELDKNKGMLFIFEKEGIYPFWMKYTLIPLDMIWINSRGKVVFIKENAQPCKGLVCAQISPKEKAKYVLEINGGLCKKFGIKAGDQARIKGI